MLLITDEETWGTGRVVHLHSFFIDLVPRQLLFSTLVVRFRRHLPCVCAIFYKVFTFFSASIPHCGCLGIEFASQYILKRLLWTLLFIIAKLYFSVILTQALAKDLFRFRQFIVDFVSFHFEGYYCCILPFFQFLLSLLFWFVLWDETILEFLDTI